jgi:glutaredoxin
MQVTLYTSAFCEPCMLTRRVLAEAAQLVPAMTVTERDIVRDASDAERQHIRTTPTVVVQGESGEVFRAEGVPTLDQVLVALAKAL